MKGLCWCLLALLFVPFNTSNSVWTILLQMCMLSLPPNGNDWFEKQTSGTLDISCSSWTDWFFGGLQFQFEHHLFPRLPRCRLWRISPLVRDLCKRHNLPYRSLSLWDANQWTIRTLRTAALHILIRHWILTIFVRCGLERPWSKYYSSCILHQYTKFMSYLLFHLLISLFCHIGADC